MRDRLGTPIRFTGELLADKRWEDAGRKLRWTDMALYAVHSMAHDQQLSVMTVCEGCRPARTLPVEQRILDEGSILCGRCGKPFVPAEVQEAEPIRYVLQIIARSCVYHRVGSPCVRSRHQLKTVAEIEQNGQRWWELKPCQEDGCKPPLLEEMAPQDRIAEEQDDPRFYLCKNAADVLNKLYRRNGEITSLAAKLLKDAARGDPDIAYAMQDRRRI